MPSQLTADPAQAFCGLPGNPGLPQAKPGEVRAGSQGGGGVPGVRRVPGDSTGHSWAERKDHRCHR